MAHATYLASYPGLITPEFVACSTTPPTGDIPNMIELVRFRGKAEIINIPQEISTDYLKVGILLLEDEARVKSIEHRYREDSEQIITEILEQWINGNDKQPVTWGTLI